MTEIRRRHLLAAAAVAPLAGCVTPPTPAPEPSPGVGTPSVHPTSTAPEPEPTPTHPFGFEAPSRLRAVVFDGAFGVEYVQRAAAMLERDNDGAHVTVTASSAIAQDVEASFTAGSTPPDLIDNSGADRLTIAELADELLDLTDVVEATNIEGELIRDTLFGGVLKAGTFDGRLLGLNYALSVYGLWHSASHFAAQGWTVPTAWDDLIALGEQARALGQFLFVWGDEAADYYAELAMASAIKEGGHEVRRALDSLAPDAWSHPAVAGVLEALEECVRRGYVYHGGGYLEAQAEWSMGRKALFYPSGSWIAKEMADRTAEGFEMTITPVPTLTAAPTLPLTAVHSQPTEQFVVPKNAANPAGGKELLRIMLSREVAAEFARENLVPTVVRSSVPADLESTALTAQARLLSEAGDDVFSWRFVSHYGLSADYQAAWASFLRGELGSAQLAQQLQALSDAVREDPAVEKYPVD